MEYLQHSADHHGSEFACSYLAGQRHLGPRDCHRRHKLPDSREKESLSHFHRACLWQTKVGHIDQAEQSVHRVVPLALDAIAPPWHPSCWSSDRPLVPLQGQGASEMLLMLPKASQLGDGKAHVQLNLEGTSVDVSADLSLLLVLA